MKQRKPIKRSVIKRKPKKAKVLWRSGRIILDAVGIKALRLLAYIRAEGRCENYTLTNASPPAFSWKRCNSEAEWIGYGHGEMHHLIHRSQGGSDTLENVAWVCQTCHRNHHDKGLEIKVLR